MSLSNISTEAKRSSNFSFNIPTDESIGAFLFDLSGFEDPFAAYPLLYNNFRDGKIQCITNMDDALLLGIENNGFLNGMVYYHLSQFFKHIGDNQTVYIAFGDCSESWDQLQYMQTQTNGRLFHIGVWTSQHIWRTKEDGEIGFTSLITDLQAQANEINGKVGESTHTMTPLHIVLCGNTNDSEDLEISYKKIPDAMELNCPKVSVFLVQNGSPEVKEMQGKNPFKAPVSSLGLIMACLSVCGAEESIASVTTCDLNKNEEFNNPEWGVGESGIPIENVHRVWTNIISSRGYIVPVSYEGIEASYYFSSDLTLSKGDFGTIANNRVMHKCRRAMGTALIYYVNSNQVFVPGTDNLSVTAISTITNSVMTVIDSVMRNKKGLQQISGRTLSFLNNSEMLENDSISLKLEITPANASHSIAEEVAHDLN